MDIVPDSVDLRNQGEEKMYDESFLEDALLQLKRYRTDRVTMIIVLNGKSLHRIHQVSFIDFIEAARTRNAQSTAEQAGQTPSESLP